MKKTLKFLLSITAFVMVAGAGVGLATGLDGNQVAQRVDAADYSNTIRVYVDLTWNNITPQGQVGSSGWGNYQIATNALDTGIVAKYYMDGTSTENLDHVNFCFTEGSTWWHPWDDYHQYDTSNSNIWSTFKLGFCYKIYNIDYTKEKDGHKYFTYSVTEVGELPKPKYTITYKANGGTGEDISEEVEVGATITTKSSNTFEAPETQKFIGWDEDPDAETPTYTAGENITPDVDEGDTFELYAIWGDIQYINYFVTNNPGWEEVYIYFYGSDVEEAPWGSGKKMHYAYNNSDNQGVLYYSIPEDTNKIIISSKNPTYNWDQTEDITYTTFIQNDQGIWLEGVYGNKWKKGGDWIASPCWVDFDVNGATTGSNYYQTADSTKSFTLNAYDSSKFSKIGSTFLGWTTNKDGSGTSYADKATISAGTIAKDQRLTLYAQWEEDVDPTEEAINFSIDFLGCVECNSKGITAPTIKGGWGDTTLEEGTLAAKFDCLSDDAKEIMHDAIADPEPTTTDKIAACVARYDLIVAKYGYYNFMARDVTPLNAFHFDRIFTDFTDGSSNNPTLIILISCVVTGLAIGGYFLLRKRKED